MSARVSAKADDMYVNSTIHTCPKGKTGDGIEVIAEGPIPIITLYRALGLALPDTQGSLTPTSARVQLQKLWHKLLGCTTVSPPPPSPKAVKRSPRTEGKLSFPLTAMTHFEAKSPLPQLVPLDESIVARFRHMHEAPFTKRPERHTWSGAEDRVRPSQQVRPGLDTKSPPSGRPVSSFHPTPAARAFGRVQILKRSADEYTSRILPTAEDTVVLFDSKESEKRPPPGFEAIDPVVLKLHLLHHIQREDTSRLEGRTLQAFVNQVIHNEPTLILHKSVPLVEQLVGILRRMGQDGICRISSDGSRFGICMPPGLDHSRLPSVDENNVAEIWLQMSRQLVNITTFAGCVNAISNSYGRWKDCTDRTTRSAAAVIAMINQGWL